MGAEKYEYQSAHEIDVSSLLKVLWRRKGMIIFFFSLFTISSVAIALYLPNVYMAQVVLAPAPNENEASSGLVGKFGGLADLAGINLSTGPVDKTQIAMEIFKSRRFISKFIEKHDVLIPLFAADRWNVKSGNLIYDRHIYDSKLKAWTRDVSAPKKPKPSEWEAYKEFIKRLSITKDRDTGMVKASLEFYSPVLAKEWLDFLVQDLNDYMRQHDIEQANKSINYLESKLSETNVPSIQLIFTKLIEENIKILMLANVRNEYILETIDPAVVAEEKSAPNRLLLIILSSFSGIVFGVLVVLVNNYWRETFAQ